MYADYAFYTELYYGTAIAEADFPRLASRASDFLDYYTRGKAANVTDEAVALALSKACCAVAEAMQTDEQTKAVAAKAAAAAMSADGEIKSESVGSHSVSYTTAADYIKGAAATPGSERANYADIASVYLAQTGLLYRGGGCRCIPPTR